MYKFDLKSGYHHIDICQAHKQILGFYWPLGGLGHLLGSRLLLISFYNIFSPTSAPLNKCRYPFSSIFGRWSGLCKGFHYYTALFGVSSVLLG